MWALQNLQADGLSMKEIKARIFAGFYLDARAALGNPTLDKLKLFRANVPRVAGAHWPGLYLGVADWQEDEEHKESWYGGMSYDTVRNRTLHHLRIVFEQGRIPTNQDWHRLAINALNAGGSVTMHAVAQYEDDEHKMIIVLAEILLVIYLGLIQEFGRHNELTGPAELELASRSVMELIGCHLATYMETEVYQSRGEATFAACPINAHTARIPIGSVDSMASIR